MKYPLLGAALLALGTSLHAATPSVTTAAFTAGARQTSANYTVDSSTGGISGIATISSTTARHGYAGQLYDVQAVAISAATNKLNEGATLQLSASATLDDSTLLALTPANLAWSVASGALASISSGGLATAQIVYQDSAATARGDYAAKFGTLALIVVNVNNDDFGLYAGDGIDDAWQVQYFGLNNTNALATADPDGDGQNNLFEYLAGTVPTNSASLFTFALSAPAAGQRALTFSPVVAGRTYTVEFRTNFTTSTFATLPGATQADNGATRTVTDVNATNAMRFYRVKISLP